MATQVFPQHPVVCLGSPVQRKGSHQHMPIPTELSREKQAWLANSTYAAIAIFCAIYNSLYCVY